MSVGTTGKISIARSNGRALACAQGMLACLRRPHLRPPAAHTPHHEEPFGRLCRTPPAEQKELLSATAVASSSTALLDCCCLRCAATTAAGAALQTGAATCWPEPIKSAARLRSEVYERLISYLNSPYGPTKLTLPGSASPVPSGLHTKAYSPAVACHDSRHSRLCMRLCEGVTHPLLGGSAPIHIGIARNTIL